MLKFLNINLINWSRIFKITGWIILILTNWKIAIGVFCVMVGVIIENDLHKQTTLDIINKTLSSLKALIKRDDLTEESKTIKNN